MTDENKELIELKEKVIADILKFFVSNKVKLSGSCLFRSDHSLYDLCRKEWFFLKNNLFEFINDLDYFSCEFLEFKKETEISMGTIYSLEKRPVQKKRIFTELIEISKKENITEEEQNKLKHFFRLKEIEQQLCQAVEAQDSKKIIDIIKKYNQEYNLFLGEKDTAYVN